MHLAKNQNISHTAKRLVEEQYWGRSLHIENCIEETEWLRPNFWESEFRIWLWPTDPPVVSYAALCIFRLAMSGNAIGGIVHRDSGLNSPIFIYSIVSGYTTSVLMRY